MVVSGVQDKVLGFSFDLEALDRQAKAASKDRSTPGRDSGYDRDGPGGSDWPGIRPCLQEKV
jgi:hypothetical protein